MSKTLLFVIALVVAFAGWGFVESKKSMAYYEEPGSIRTVITAQVTYKATYPKVGYACDLRSLGGTAGTELEAGLIDDTLASGTKSGYRFEILQPCRRENGVNVGYRLLARPLEEGKPVYCTDETGVVRRYTGSAAECLEKGEVFGR